MMKKVYAVTPDTYTSSADQAVLVLFSFQSISNEKANRNTAMIWEVETMPPK